MGIFSFLAKRADKQIAAQIENLISILKEAPEQNLSAVLVAAGRLRATLKGRGIDLGDPMSVRMFHQDVVSELLRHHENCRKNGQHVSQVCCAVWLASIRSTASNRLAPLGPEVWRQLSRGRSKLYESYAHFLADGGEPFDLEASVSPPRFYDA